MKNQIRLANGETYAYLEKGHGNRVLLLVHGNLSSSEYYVPLIDRIPDGIRVLAPDLRGFGDSSFLTPFRSLKELAEDLSLFLEALGVKKADVVGWSLGGGVAMEFAAAHPEKTEKLILIASTTHRGYPIYKKNAAFQPLVGQPYASPEEMATDPLQVKPVVDAIAAKNAAFLAYIYDLTIYTHNKPTAEANAVYIAETLKQRNLPDVDFALAALNMGEVPNDYGPGTKTIGHIGCPVLHVWGTLDRTVPEWMVLDNIRALENQSRYVRLEACGHSPLVDCPDALAAAVREFLS